MEKREERDGEKRDRKRETQYLKGMRERDNEKDRNWKTEYRPITRSVFGGPELSVSGSTVPM